VFQVVPIEARHRAFVEDTFLRSVSESWPFDMCDWRQLRADLRLHLKRPEVRSGVAVLAKDPDSYLGWAAVVPRENLVIYAYTTAAYRTRYGFEPRVCSSLVNLLGGDTTKELKVRYWTKASDAISRHPGWKLERE
jgi:hypothetical protein